MRTIPANLLAALAAPDVHPVYLIELDFPTGVERLHTWIGDLVGLDPIDGAPLTFQGVGGLGEVRGVEQPDAIRGGEIEATLSGVDVNLLSISLIDDYQGRSARLFLGALDADEASLIDDGLIPINRGKIDTMTIALGASATIALRAVNEAQDWEQPRIVRYSDAEQRRRFPDDTGLSRIGVTSEVQVRWRP